MKIKIDVRDATLISAAEYADRRRYYDCQGALIVCRNRLEFSDLVGHVVDAAILTDDLTDGYLIGEWNEVKALHATLARLLETDQADEQIQPHDERLGVKWLSVSEAAEQWGVSTDTVRYAAREGHIPNAEKQGNMWRFPQRNFLFWLSKVHQPRG